MRMACVSSARASAAAVAAAMRVVFTFSEGSRCRLFALLIIALRRVLRAARVLCVCVMFALLDQRPCASAVRATGHLSLWPC